MSSCVNCLGGKCPHMPFFIGGGTCPGGGGGGMSYTRSITDQSQEYIGFLIINLVMGC